jgi:hypothetical protein
MKQDASFFEDREAVLVYIAKRLKEALRLEELFANAGLDFGVEADQYSGGIIFHTARTGAFFYVLPDSVAAAHQLLRSNGYTPHEGPPDKA